LSYDRADFPVGYPAATGIGQATGGIHLEFIALDAPTAVEVSPISNPQQIDAHCYSTDVLVGRPAGHLPERTSPKFERAKRLAWDGGEIVFVSGTASIVGEQSVGLGDPVEQTRTTLGHIGGLLGGETPSYLRAYVKHARDIAAVRGVCEKTYPHTPVTYVEADVCRGELLVEIEGLRVVAIA
jgi:enamine deaminase RidA (YjgF/YER057c/UK114 family)